MIASLIHRLVDFIVPLGCAGCGLPVHSGALWCPVCAASVVTLPDASTQLTVQGHRLIVPFAYAGPAANAIHRLKYKNRPELAQALGRRLAFDVRLAGLPREATLVPVPATAERIVERGYNQAALLASALSCATGLKYCPGGLRRTYLAPHQVGANKAQRAEQVAGAFVANPRAISDAHIVLVDDVVTTGATSAACAEAIQAVGARLVAVVAVARVL